jgi:hypothetical protein
MMDVGKGGRPREGEEAKRAPLNMRTSPQIRARLEAEAEKNACSLTQEVERRLQLTFDSDTNFGGSHNYTFFRMVMATVHTIEQRNKAIWVDDQDTFWAVRAAISHLMEINAPSDSRTTDAVDAAFYRNNRLDRLKLLQKQVQEQRMMTHTTGSFGSSSDRLSRKVPSVEDLNVLSRLEDDLLGAQEDYSRAERYLRLLSDPLQARIELSAADGKDTAVEIAAEMFKARGSKLRKAQQWP